MLQMRLLIEVADVCMMFVIFEALLRPLLRL
jgi:hypothetical protein